MMDNKNTPDLTLKDTLMCGEYKIKHLHFIKYSFFLRQKFSIEKYMYAWMYILSSV